MSAAAEFSSQWQNPSDILSLLLLVGGDTVQKAIAQLFGVYIQPSNRCPRIYLTPVAFSFGWVAYAFNSLTSVVGDMQLMPSTPDCPSEVINCATGYSRVNQSWLLGRIIRDHEIAAQARPGEVVARLSDEALLRDASLEDHGPLQVSLRIDIFSMNGDQDDRLEIDHVWILGWCTIAVQLIISFIPWVLYGNWGVFLITTTGTLFALLTGSLRQWSLEKWPGRRLNKSNSTLTSENQEYMSAFAPTPGGDVEIAMTNIPGANSCKCKRAKAKKKTVCITKGNGHRFALVLIGAGTAWDLETLATATSGSLPETPWLLGVLAIAWLCLLVCVSGLKSNTWFLVVVGGLGMVQNLYASSAPRSPRSMGLALDSYTQRPTIIGSSTCEPMFWPKEEGEQAVSDDESMAADHPLVGDALDPIETAGVRGAIRELEKTIPGAGFALMPVFFPALVRIDRERYRDAREARFWRWMLRHPKREQRRN